MASNHLAVHEVAQHLKDLIRSSNIAQLQYLEAVLGELYHKAKETRLGKE